LREPAPEEIDSIRRPGAVIGHRADFQLAEDGVGVLGEVVLRPAVEGEQHGAAVVLAQERLGVSLVAGPRTWQLEAATPQRLPRPAAPQSRTRGGASDSLRCLLEPGHGELEALLRAPAAEVARRRPWSRRPDGRAAAKARGVEAGSGWNQVEYAGANGCRSTRAGHTADPEVRNRPALSRRLSPRLRMDIPARHEHIGHARTSYSRPGEQRGQGDG
jgi:hypothetical protein